ncbi:PH domain-containing protein [Aliiglaciecola sp. CAU 1673]|uniref:PH domain-containing protein n=1 Tax=Aliiglaciecola sp. CAU 1673 TaxID=3032595 RepID=UPI0023DCD304|nr:PH domain-containing protein [Aliiglaciecola sp. CAU 1673]MDF2180379.1 PH domain-containing protein [Aliiglaciecola sp. CAU 1673]
MVLILGPLLLSALGVWVMAQTLWIGVSLILVALITAIVCLRFILPCHYILTSDQLLVRCGLTTLSLSYKGIRKIGPTHNFLWAPALSKRRLEIDSSEGYLLISPKNRQKFMAELSQRMHPRRSTSAKQDNMEESATA